MKAAALSDADIGRSELSFAEPVTRKRRGDMSTLSELGECKHDDSIHLCNEVVFQIEELVV